MSDSLSLNLLVYIKQKQPNIAALSRLPADMADGDSSLNPPCRLSLARTDTFTALRCSRPQARHFWAGPDSSGVATVHLNP